MLGRKRAATEMHACTLDDGNVICTDLWLIGWLTTHARTDPFSSFVLSFSVCYSQDMRRDSSLSVGSSSFNNGHAKKKRTQKDRNAERLRKLDAQASDIDIGHIVDADNDSKNGENGGNGDEEAADVFFENISPASPPIVSFKDLRGTSTTLDRSSSDQSTGSLLYCKTPSTGGGGVAGILSMGGMSSSSSLGKSSLIFPTGVDSVSADDHRGGGGRQVSSSSSSTDAKHRRSKVNLRLDQVEAVRFPFKKKLMLNNLNLTAADIPMKDLCNNTPLGNSLYKLSLAGNRLGAVPAKLVQSLPALRTLDLSQCELHQLPDQWNLPKLTRLNLSHNRFTEFPEEVRRCHFCVCVLDFFVGRFEI